MTAAELVIGRRYDASRDGEVVFTGIVVRCYPAKASFGGHIVVMVEGLRRQVLASVYGPKKRSQETEFVLAESEEGS